MKREFTSAPFLDYVHSVNKMITNHRELMVVSCTEIRVVDADHLAGDFAPT